MNPSVRAAAVAAALVPVLALTGCARTAPPDVGASALVGTWHDPEGGTLHLSADGTASADELWVPRTLVDAAGRWHLGDRSLRAADGSVLVTLDFSADPRARITKQTLTVHGTSDDPTLQIRAADPDDPPIVLTR